MSRYCTTGALKILWGSASFNNLTTLAQKMIDQAESEIDKHLSQRYDISSATFQTTSSIPPAVTTVCEWLSIGYLYEATARGSKDAFQRADRYIKKAMKNLEAMLDYNANLVDANGDIVDSKSDDFQILSSTKDYEPTFNEDHPLNWQLDPDKADDIADERD